MSTQFVIALSSSLTTALILWIVRQVVKAKNTFAQMVEQTAFLMRTMDMVLRHLKLENDAERFRNPRRR